jgi:hypothetical protein
MRDARVSTVKLEFFCGAHGSYMCKLDAVRWITYGPDGLLIYFADEVGGEGLSVAGRL